MKRINGEPVELVTDFGALAVGDVCWATLCPRCDGKHRLLLIERGRFKTDLADGIGFRALPGLHDRTDGTCIRPETVRAGRLYRVINPPREEVADDHVGENFSVTVRLR